MAFAGPQDCIKGPSMSQIEKRWFLVLIFSAGLCSTPNCAAAQANNSNLPDSPSEVSRYKHRNDPGSNREVSWRSLPKDFLHDQKGIWLFPTQLAKGHYWFPP